MFKGLWNTRNCFRPGSNPLSFKYSTLKLQYMKSIRHHFFLSGVFLHEQSRVSGKQRKEEAISLTPLYHFHPLLRHLGISRVTAAEGSPLHMTSSRTRAGNLWFPSASHESLSYVLLKGLRFNGRALKVYGSLTGFPEVVTAHLLFPVDTRTKLNAPHKTSVQSQQWIQ